MRRHEAELQHVVPVQIGDGQSPYAHTPDYRTVAELALARGLAQKYYLEARTDELTNIGNRRAFNEDLQDALEGVTETTNIAVLYLDVDGLKRVNDADGHDEGDRLLKMVASSFRSGHDRQEDTWYRLGGDEVVAIFQNVRSRGGQTVETVARGMANRLENRMNAEIGEEDRWFDLHAGVSIGVAVNEPGDIVDTLLARAEADMETNKGARRKYLEERGIVFGDSRAIVGDPLLDARRTRKQWADSAIIDDYGTVVE